MTAANNEACMRLPGRVSQTLQDVFAIPFSGLFLVPRIHNNTGAVFCFGTMVYKQLFSLINDSL